MEGSEFNPDLVSKVKPFVEHMHMSDSERVARKDWLGGLPDNDLSHDGPDLETFTEKYPDFWMAHPSMLKYYDTAPSWFQLALRFARRAPITLDIVLLNQMRRKMPKFTNALASGALVHRT